MRVLDWYFCTVIGRTRHMTSPVWSSIDWLAKIRIVGLSFSEIEMDKTVQLKLYLHLSGWNKHSLR